MNRIILIGNGFDLAHGLPTSYGNFIDWYWEQWKIHLENNNQTYTESPLLKFHNRSGENISYFIDRKIKHLTGRDIGFALMENDYSFSVEACPLLEEICTSIETKGWVDIENIYYNLLVKCSNDNDVEGLQFLNIQFARLQELLCEYLTSIPKKNFKVNERIRDIIYSPINPNDVSVGGKQHIIDHAKYWAECNDMDFEDKMNVYKKALNLTGINNVNNIYYSREKNKQLSEADLYQTPVNYNAILLPDNIMVLNFNYTKLACNYIEEDGECFKINNIHGELDMPDSVIFGYGDDLDENYKKISNLNDNRYLTNFKSIKYLESDNYRKALQFMDAAPYQVFIMGHSCGNSDRTLLNKLFEHKNCVSVKPYFYQMLGSDNYLDIVQNISRNFTDMNLMRDRVVNKLYCDCFSEEH